MRSLYIRMDEGIKGMREVVLVPIVHGEIPCIRVQHSDPSLNELLWNISRRQEGQEE